MDPLVEMFSAYGFAGVHKEGANYLLMVSDKLTGNKKNKPVFSKAIEDSNAIYGVK